MELIIFVLATIPALLLTLCVTMLLTWMLYKIGMGKVFCALYFPVAMFFLCDGSFTTNVPVGKTVYAVIGVSQDAY